MATFGKACRWTLLLLLLGCGAGCGDNAETPAVAVASAKATAAAVVAAGGVVLPPAQPYDANPFGLPSQPLELAVGSRVFAVTEAMLRGATLGRAMKLYSAKVLGREGELVQLRIGTGKPYLAHPAYMVQPKDGRLRRGAPLFAAYRGVLKHGVLRRMAPRRGIVVRFTDLGYRLSDQTLKRSRVGMLPAGLAPGGYAVMRGDHSYEHVTLVSNTSSKDGKRRWLVFGYAGTSRLVPEDRLVALPPPRYRPRTGDEVLVAWRGTMVAARIRNVDLPGLFMVQRRRAGGALTVGPGMLMPAPDH